MSLTVSIRCQFCRDVIELPATDTIENGTPTISIAEEDYADLWAHMWMHTEAPA